MLQRLLRKVEEKVNRGSSDKWTKYDFEQVSEAIFAATNVQLSIITLKRIWGKVKYPHEPAVQTLNALAQFTGYNDWRDFELRNNNLATTIAEKSPSGSPASLPVKRNSISKYLVFVLAIPLLGLIYLAFKRQKLNKIIPENYSFSLSKVKTTGVPNSVIFSYDASRSPTDSVFIVQTWDISRKTLVPKNGQRHSAIYYYPGFFNTKLIIDNVIVTRQDLQISTDGWLGLVQTDDKPIYFKKQEIYVEEGVSITDSLLNKYEISIKPKSPRIRFFNQRDMDNLMNDNFDFETVIRNPIASADNICQNTEVLIQCKDDIIIIPLASQACVGNMRLAFNGAVQTSQLADFSKFGCDLSQWTKLKIICRNRHARIFVNDILAMELDAPNEPVEIVGVQYRFNGWADIRYSRFWNQSGKLIDLN